MYSAPQMINHIDLCIPDANYGVSKLPRTVLLTEGMSSPKNRRLLNNIMDMPDVNYLEIGVCRGSTFISALYANDHISAYAIDNWSQFGGNREDFEHNCSLFKIDNFTLIEGDAYEVDLSRFTHKINVFFYDGHHSAKATSDAIVYYKDVLSDEFVFIVDDFNWKGPNEGSCDGIKKSEMKIVHKWQLQSFRSNDKDSWWNGMGIFILSK